MSSIAIVDDMGVHNVGFLIETLGADAGELQYLRELVQNSFESIGKQRSDRPGRVEIDFELVKGVRKLRITDNGVGMTPDEVRANINNLSASGGEQAFDKNFGIGAKITAGTRNPHGVMFKTWKNGEGALDRSWDASMADMAESASRMTLMPALITGCRLLMTTGRS